MSRDSFARESPVLSWYALMMDSLTSPSISMAFCISAASPKAMVAGLWIIMHAVGAMSTVVPAIATTDAADAAMPSIFTVTGSLYSMSIV